MKQRKKQLLGLLGLVAVMVMTAFAWTLPTHAKSESADITVRMTINGPGRSLTIVSPQDGDTAVLQSNGDASIVVKTMQENINKIEYNMVCTNSAGTQFTASAESIINESAGEDQVTLTLPEKPSDSDCTIEARGYNEIGGEVARDTVDIYFREMIVHFTGYYDKYGNPQVYVEVTEAVDKSNLQVYDKNGKPIFKNPIVLGESGDYSFTDRTDGINSGNKYTYLFLPMAQNNAPKGNYELISEAYDGDKIVSLNDNPFYYGAEEDAGKKPTTEPKPGDGTYPSNDLPQNNLNKKPNDGSDVAGLPNAGSILKDLNISRADFILTGVVVFAAVSGFALYLIFRKRHQA